MNKKIACIINRYENLKNYEVKKEFVQVEVQTTISKLYNDYPEWFKTMVKEKVLETLKEEQDH